MPPSPGVGVGRNRSARLGLFLGELDAFEGRDWVPQHVPPEGLVQGDAGDEFLVAGGDASLGERERATPIVPGAGE